VYENGVFRPLAPLDLVESEKVRLTVSTEAAERSQRDMEIVARARAEVDAMGITPTIEEVRAALASIPGSMSEFIIAERGEY
jgi:predicted DNA-binding antitoxin AbrB/MazE fold protein